MRRIAVRQVTLFAAAAAVMLAIATVLWLLSGTGAQADPATVVGIDVDTDDNGPTVLGDIDTCITKDIDDAFLVDIYVDDLPTDNPLNAFGYTLNFDDDRLRVREQDHDWLLGVFGAGVPNDGASEAVPDDTSPHVVMVSEFADPEIGLTRGVLARYTLEVKATATQGLADLTLEDVSLSGEGGAVAISEVGSATIAVAGVACPTPTATPSPTPSPTASPTPEPTESPSPTPSPTATATPTRSLTLSPQGWHNFVWTGPSAGTATALGCIAGKYNAAYQWLGSAVPPQWLHYFPARPDLSNITTVDQYDALLVQITADGVTCEMPVEPGPAATATATPTPSPTPTATATE